MAFGSEAQARREESRTGGPQYVGNVNTYFRPLLRPNRPVELTPAQAGDLDEVRKLLREEKWPEFRGRQIELLVAEGISRTQAEKLYAPFE